ncbi:MAG: hypothetical protein RIR66_1033 [Actinomycetota bacterium]|jgi:hypothetical protein
MKKVVLAVALASSLLVSGCAAGFDAQTNQQGNSGNGRTADVDNIQIRNAVIVVDEKNQETGTLVATIISKNESDLLVGIEIDPAITATGSAIELKKDMAVAIGYNSDTSIPLATIGAALTPGQFVDVNFVFGKNKSIKLSLLVVENTGYYSDVVIPIAEPSATPTPSAS